MPDVKHSYTVHVTWIDKLQPKTFGLFSSREVAEQFLVSLAANPRVESAEIKTSYGQ